MHDDLLNLEDELASATDKMDLKRLMAIGSELKGPIEQARPGLGDKATDALHVAVDREATRVKERYQELTAQPEKAHDVGYRHDHKAFWSATQGMPSAKASWQQCSMIVNQVIPRLQAAADKVELIEIMTKLKPDGISDQKIMENIAELSHRFATHVYPALQSPHVEEIEKLTGGVITMALQAFMNIQKMDTKCLEPLHSVVK